MKQPGKPPEEDPERLLIGHAHNICSIAFSEDGSKVVSGAWDSQAFVWDVEKGEVSAELQGHGGNVWGVLVYDSKLVLTGMIAWKLVGGWHSIENEDCTDKSRSVRRQAHPRLRSERQTPPHDIRPHRCCADLLQITARSLVRRCLRISWERPDHSSLDA